MYESSKPLHTCVLRYGKYQKVGGMKMKALALMVFKIFY